MSWKLLQVQAWTPATACHVLFRLNTLHARSPQAFPPPDGVASLSGRGRPPRGKARSLARSQLERYTAAGGHTARTEGGARARPDARGWRCPGHSRSAPRLSVKDAGGAGGRRDGHYMCVGTSAGQRGALPWGSSVPEAAASSLHSPSARRPAGKNICGGRGPQNLWPPESTLCPE